MYYQIISVFSHHPINLKNNLSLFCNFLKNTLTIIKINLVKQIGEQEEKIAMPIIQIEKWTHPRLSRPGRTYKRKEVNSG